MSQKGNPSIRKSLWQISALLVLAVLLAVCVNHFRSDGIPLFGDWSEEARFSDTSGTSLIISPAEAQRLFEQNAALFVDARPENQYAEGHIRGALNIPFQEVDRYFTEAADRLTAANEIITYCDGEGCDLSHELALFLKEMGFKNVRVLVNGWTIWRQAGLPMEGENG